jgi:lipopolysaccharide/colanic/teichoic acid biosynthesis glycosyltransferase
VTGRGANRAILAGGFTGFVNLSARTRLVQELVERGLAVDIVTGGPENLYSRATTQDVEGLPLISVQPSTVRPLALAIKRAFDLVVSILALVALSPVMAWAAIRVKTGSSGPVFYRDPRTGRDDREFLAIKFRTMVEGADQMRPGLRDEADPAGEKVMFKLADDPRVTGVGRTLRVWSIDELPQLWNVIKGDMSLVGPRPLPPDEAQRAEELFAARSRMRPGLAGPWQALGRSTIPFEEMVRLDYSSVLSRKGSM